MLRWCDRGHWIKLIKAKCHFGKTEMQRINHIISADTVRPGSDKMKAITQISGLINVKGLSRFLVLSAHLQFPAQTGKWVGVEWCTKGAVKPACFDVTGEIVISDGYGWAAALPQEDELKPGYSKKTHSQTKKECPGCVWVSSPPLWARTGIPGRLAYRPQRISSALKTNPLKDGTPPFSQRLFCGLERRNSLRVTDCYSGEIEIAQLFSTSRHRRAVFIRLLEITLKSTSKSWPVC